MNLLIVDDESYIIREIIDILHPLIETESLTLFSATDGVAGLEQALQNPPDLLITDVQMPRLNGLLLSEQIQKFAPECITIFLSNYSDSDYLKKAIHLHAAEYLDKPIIPGQLTAIVREQIDNIHRIHKERSLHQEQINVFFHNAQFILSQLWGQMLRNKNANIEVLREPCKHYKMTHLFHSVYRCLLFRIEPDSASFISFPRIDGIGMLPPDLFQKRILLLILYADDTVSLNDAIVRILWEQMKSCPYISGLCVSSLAKDYTQVQSVWQRTLTAFDQFIFCAPPQICFLNNVGTFSVQQYTQITEQIAAIITPLHLPDHKLPEFLNPDPAVRKHSEKDLYNDCCRLSELLFDHSAEHLLNFHRVHTNFDLYQQIWNCPDAESLLETIKSWVKELSEFGIGDDRTAHMILNYIQENYADPKLGLENLSVFTGYSKSRLCIVFKRITDLTIIDYITKVRMDAACELLRNTNFSVKEISRKTGFTDPSYFGKVFRQTIHETPKEYRRRNNPG